MERSSRPRMTSMSLARFSLKYTTHFPMGIYAYGGIYLWVIGNAGRSSHRLFCVFTLTQLFKSAFFYNVAGLHHIPWIIVFICLRSLEDFGA